MSALVRILATLACSGVLSVACGGSTDDGESGGASAGPVTIDQLPAALADAYCATLTPCCQAAGVPINATSCRSNLQAGFTDSFQSADPANYTYDANAAGACVGQIRQLGGNACSGFTSSLAPAETGCDQFVQGLLEPGAPCVSDIECSAAGGGDAQCDSVDGICTVERRGTVGDACYWTCTEIEGGTSCSGSGAEQTPDQGQCFINDGLYCAEDSVCAAQAARGGACTGDEACTDGLYCDSQSGTCLELLAAGEACTFNECGEGLYCRNGACAPELEPGSPCVQFDDECRNGSCQNGICEENGSLGDVGIALACAFLAGGFSMQTP